MNRVITYRGAIPTSRQAVHTCTTAVQRVLSLVVTNTTTGNLSFVLDVDRGGTEYEVLDDLIVYASSAQKDTFEWVPGLFPLTKAEPSSSSPEPVGDIIGITASGVGLKFHLAVEVLDEVPGR